MSIVLRLLLIVASILTFLYMIRKLRKEQLETMDTLFWTIFVLTIMIMSLFPDIIIKCTEYLGVQSPVNFVFLVIIFFCIIRIFLLNVRICRLEQKLREYIEKMAVRSNLGEE